MPAPADSKSRTPAKVPDSLRTRSACEPQRAFIEGEVDKGRNAVAIYQDLVEHHGYGGRYDAVKRFVRKRRAREPKISCRFESEPGQEGQSDYGAARTQFSAPASVPGGASWTVDRPYKGIRLTAAENRVLRFTLSRQPDGLTPRLNVAHAGRTSSLYVVRSEAP